MHTRRLRALTTGALAVALLAWLAGCGGGDATPEATPTLDPGLPPNWPTAVSSLASLDFTSAPLVDEVMRLANGGTVPAERVVLHDLLADEAPEALVIVESGGTLGDVGVAVFELLEGVPTLVSFIEASGRVEFDADLDLIFVTEGVYEPGDAECCPSKLREIAYGWDGEAFAAVSDQVVDNPSR